MRGTLLWQPQQTNTPKNEYVLPPCECKPTNGWVWAENSGLQCFHGVSQKSGCHLKNGCFDPCLRQILDCDKCNASVWEKQSCFQRKTTRQGPQLHLREGHKEKQMCLQYTSPSACIFFGQNSVTWHNFSALFVSSCWQQGEADIQGKWRLGAGGGGWAGRWIRA